MALRVGHTWWSYFLFCNLTCWAWCAFKTTSACTEQEWYMISSFTKYGGRKDSSSPWDCLNFILTKAHFSFAWDYLNFFLVNKLKLLLYAAFWHGLMRYISIPPEAADQFHIKSFRILLRDLEKPSLKAFSSKELENKCALYHQLRKI